MSESLSWALRSVKNNGPGEVFRQGRVLGGESKTIADGGDAKFTLLNLTANGMLLMLFDFFSSKNRIAGSAQAGHRVVAASAAMRPALGFHSAKASRSLGAILGDAVFESQLLEEVIAVKAVICWVSFLPLHLGQRALRLA